MLRTSHTSSAPISSLLTALVCSAVVLCASPGLAAEGTAAEPTAPRVLASSDVTAVWADNDGFARFGLGLQLSFEDIANPQKLRIFGAGEGLDLSIDLYAPISLRVIDDGVQTDAVFRRREWDENAEGLRVLRSLRLGSPYAPVYLALGNLGVTRAGHGSAVDGVNNNVDMDHFRWGVQTGLNAGRGGVELLVDDIRTPWLFGGRIWLRPGTGALSRRILVGASLFADPSAPLALHEQSPTGGGAAAAVPVSDDRGVLRVADSELFIVTGVDAELELIASSQFRLTPYVDLNIQPELGMGVHAGGFAAWTPGQAFSLSVRGEFRAMSSRYRPGYFGATYGAERYDLPGIDGVQTLLSVVRASEPGPHRGFAIDVEAHLTRLLAVGAGLESGNGLLPASMHLRGEVTVPVIGLRAALRWESGHYEHLRDIKVLERALIGSDVTWQMMPWLAIRATAGQRWRAAKGRAYEPIPEVSLGLVFSFRVD